MKFEYRIYVLHNEGDIFSRQNVYALREYINHQSDPQKGVFDNEEDAVIWMKKLHPYGCSEFVVQKVYMA